MYFIILMNTLCIYIKFFIIESVVRYITGIVLDSFNCLFKNEHKVMKQKNIYTYYIIHSKRLTKQTLRWR